MTDPAAIDQLLMSLDAEATMQAPRGVAVKLRQAIAAIKALREKVDSAWNEAWDLAHEPARCGHVRANYKDPKFGTPRYKGNEKCEACAEVKALQERMIKLNKELEEHRICTVDCADLEAALEYTKAAEARVAELWNTLDFMVTQVEDTWHPDSFPLTEAHTVLSAAPGDALERARAVEAKGYAAGLEAAASWLDEVGAISAADPATTGKIWPVEAAKTIRTLDKGQS